MSNFEEQLMEVLGSTAEPVNSAHQVEVRSPVQGKKGVAEPTPLKVDAADASLVEFTVETVTPAQVEVRFLG